MTKVFSQNLEDFYCRIRVLREYFNKILRCDHYVIRIYAFLTFFIFLDTKLRVTSQFKVALFLLWLND